MKKKKHKRVSNVERRSISLNAILGAAEHLFVTQRFHTTTIDQIAERANLTKGAVYFYFSDKTTILLKLIERVETLIYKPVFETLKDSSVPPRERLVQFVHKLSRWGQTQRNALLLPIIIAPEFWGTRSPVEKKLRAMYDDFAQSMEQLIDDGKAIGAFANHAPTREMASVLVAMSDGMLLEWARRRNELDGSLYVAAARRFLLSGMTPAPTSSPSAGTAKSKPAG